VTQQRRLRWHYIVERYYGPIYSPSCAASLLYGGTVRLDHVPSDVEPTVATSTHTALRWPPSSRTSPPPPRAAQTSSTRHVLGCKDSLLDSSRSRMTSARARCRSASCLAIATVWATSSGKRSRAMLTSMAHLLRLVGDMVVGGVELF
jgi:hypothetical protein